MATFDLTIRAHPRASRNTVVLKDAVVHVYTTVPPVDGEANEAICALLAKHLGIAKSSLRLVRGDSGREKIFRIEGNEAELRQKLGFIADE